MHTDRIWLDLALPSWAAVVLLLAQTAWRARTTAIGRGFVVLVLLSAATSLLGLVRIEKPSGRIALLKINERQRDRKMNEVKIDLIDP